MEFIESRLVPLRQAGRLIGPGTSLGVRWLGPVCSLQSVFTLHSGHSKIYIEEIPLFLEGKETTQSSVRPGLILDLSLTLPTGVFTLLGT